MALQVLGRANQNPSQTFVQPLLIFGSKGVGLRRVQELQSTRGFCMVGMIIIGT